MIISKNWGQKILQHIIECERPEYIETVSHIARSLHLAQPTVFKSVKNLTRAHYLEYGAYGDLIVTGKGAAAAIILGVIVDRIEMYVSNLGTHLSSYKLSKYVKYVEEHPNDYKEKYTESIHYYIFTEVLLIMMI